MDENELRKLSGLQEAEEDQDIAKALNDLATNLKKKNNKKTVDKMNKMQPKFKEEAMERINFLIGFFGTV